MIKVANNLSLKREPVCMKKFTKAMTLSLACPALLTAININKVRAVGENRVPSDKSTKELTTIQPIAINSFKQTLQQSGTSGWFTFSVATNIRTAPNLQAPVVGQYDPGEAVYYLGQCQADGYTWLRYIAMSGKERYVAMISNPDKQPEPLQTQTTATAVQNVQAADGHYTFKTTTNIHLVPDPQSKVVGQYHAGEVVHYDGILEKHGYSWFRYRAASGKVCYVAKINPLKVTQTQQQTKLPSYHHSGVFKFLVPTHIRTAPGLTASIVGQYEVGDEVYYDGQVQADGYTWLRYIAASGRICYVAMIIDTQTTAEQRLSSPATQKLAVKPIQVTRFNNQVVKEKGAYTFTSNTNIYTAPSRHANIVGAYKAGETVYYNGKVLADGFTWLKYQSVTGRTCYVIVDTEALAHQKAKLVKSNKSGHYTFSQATKIRTAPSLSAPVVGQYEAGEHLAYKGKVTADGYTWLSYTSLSGRTCYVAQL